MPTLQQTAARHSTTINNKEAIVAASQLLMEHGVYPIEACLHDGALAVGLAADLIKLEESVTMHSDTCMALAAFVKLNSERLISESVASKQINADKISLAMINCVVLSEGIGKFVRPAVDKIIASTRTGSTVLEATIAGRYGVDGIRLLEFCLWQSPAVKLLAESADMKVVFRTIAEELSQLPIGKLRSLAESVPDIDLFVSSELHRRLAGSVAAGR